MFGEMVEWLMTIVLKTIGPERGPWVRILLSPQLKTSGLSKFFSGGSLKDNQKNPFRASNWCGPVAGENTWDSVRGSWRDGRVV
jgi:hypothetical protein